ncbi:MAG: metallophosphoesterase [Bradymonadaceae bacterium]
MSRIAVISDIHGNPFALRAAVEDIRRCEVDEVLVGGDLVGRGPLGSRIVDRIRDLGWQTIRGNHEDYLLSFRREDVPDGWLDAEEWAASRWMAAELDESHADFIDSLPMSTTASTAPDLRLVHGSPDSYTDGIGEWTPEEELASHLSAIDEELLVCAHTHRPVDRQLPAGRVVNVGSIGLPFNGDERAQYAIFERTASGWTVDFRQVDYDRGPLLDAYRETGFLDEGGITAEILNREVRAARPFLVPFFKWAEARDRPRTRRAFAEFLEIYDPSAPLADIFERIASG